MKRGFFILSLLLHGTLLLGLTGAEDVGWIKLAPPLPEAAKGRLSAAQERAQSHELQRRVQTLERVREEMATRGGGKPSGDQPKSDKKPGEANQSASRKRPPLPTDRASLERELDRLSREIDQKHLEARAQELAQLTGTTPEQALKKLRAEEAQRPRPATDEERQRRALEILAQQRAREQARAEGTRLAAAPASAAAGASGNSPRSNAGLSNPFQRSAGGASSGGAASSGANASTANSNGANPGGVMGAGTGQPGIDPRGSGSNNDIRNYQGNVAGSAVASGMRGGSGARIGPGGVYANRIPIDTWYVIGPFESRGPQSLDVPIPPERIVDLDATYSGKGGRTVRWERQNQPSYPFVPTNAEDDAVYYGFAEIHLDQPRTVRLSLGADDDAQVWLNNHLVWRSGNEMKPWYRDHFRTLSGEIAQLNLTETTQTVQLNAGRNTLRFKLYNGYGATFVSVVMGFQ